MDPYVMGLSVALRRFLGSNHDQDESTFVGQLSGRVKPRKIFDFSDTSLQLGVAYRLSRRFVALKHRAIRRVKKFAQGFVGR